MMNSIAAIPAGVIAMPNADVPSTTAIPRISPAFAINCLAMILSSSL